MASNTTLPNCSPIQFPEPPKCPNQWVTPLISGVCGLVGLGMVLWFLVWVIRYVKSALFSLAVSVVLIDICVGSMPGRPC